MHCLRQTLNSYNIYYCQLYYILPILNGASFKVIFIFFNFTPIVLINVGIYIVLFRLIIQERERAIACQCTRVIRVISDRSVKTDVRARAEIEKKNVRQEARCGPVGQRSFRIVGSIAQLSTFTRL